MHSMNTTGLNGMYLDRDIATSIGRFFYDQSASDELKADDWSTETLNKRCNITKQTIDSLRIINIHFDGKFICITTSRPGILIGRKGEQINKLTEYLRKEFTFEKISITEDRVVSSLYDFYYVLDAFSED